MDHSGRQRQRQPLFRAGRAASKAKAHAALLIGAAAGKIEASFEQARCRLIYAGRWRARLRRPQRAPGAAILLSRRPARVSISSRITNTAAASSKNGACLERSRGWMAQLKTDWVLFLTILVMVGFGLVMLYSASSSVGRAAYTWSRIISSFASWLGRGLIRADDVLKRRIS